MRLTMMTGAARLRKKKLIMHLSAFVMAILVMSVSGCAFYPKEGQELEPPLIGPATIEYKAEPAARGTLIRQLRLTGIFAIRTQIPLSFEQIGRIKAKYAREGQKVKAGDPIIELDSTDLVFRIAILEIDIKKSRLNISQLSENRASDYAIQTARLNLKQQELQLAELNGQMAATKIAAQSDGIVTYIISTAIGEMIGAGQIVAMIGDLSSLVLVARGESAIKLPVGAKVAVTVREKEYWGEVTANPTTLYVDPDESLHEAAIITVSDDLADGKAFGNTAGIVYVLDIREDVIILKRGSIHSMNGRDYVNVLEEGVRVEKDVEIGRITDTEAEIVKGLEEGDLVIGN